MCCSDRGSQRDPYVQMFLSLCDREIRHSGRHSLHTNFSLDHPIEEAGRLLSATLLRHTHLTPQLIEVLEQGRPGSERRRQPWMGVNFGIASRSSRIAASCP
ncbi:hypothetical protein E2C01_059367 [Portunus trituberculatus]|uniref:Uncharacterized protein n=1 Tax=Portunus trituberculatus TaxID=210409 RepID=A0A5B7H8W2_PORTR|nr:hypothetical protein [Portunus trituberculatus]